jgi:hypothetical protein
MIYKKDSDVKSSFYTQSFISKEPEYKLSKDGLSLEVVGEIDVQEKIQSFSSCALDKILDKFLDVSNYVNPNATIVDEVFDYTDLKSDLADLGDLYDKAEFYKEQFGLPLEFSANEVYSWLNSKSRELGYTIENLLKQKGVMKDETKENEEESEYPQFPKNGEQGSQEESSTQE